MKKVVKLYLIDIFTPFAKGVKASFECFTTFL